MKIRNSKITLACISAACLASVPGWADFSRSRPTHAFDVTRLDGSWKLTRVLVAPENLDEGRCSANNNPGETISVQYELRDSDSHSWMMSDDYYAVVEAFDLENIDQGVNDTTRSKYEPFSCVLDSAVPGGPTYSHCIQDRQQPPGAHNDTYVMHDATYTTSAGSVIDEYSETDTLANSVQVESEVKTLTLQDANHLEWKVVSKSKSDTQAHTTLNCLYERVSQ